MIIKATPTKHITEFYHDLVKYTFIVATSQWFYMATFYSAARLCTKATGKAIVVVVLLFLLLRRRRRHRCRRRYHRRRRHRRRRRRHPSLVYIGLN